MLRDLLAAIALLLVFEGIIPFLSPQKWREYIQTIGQCEDKIIRRIGFFSMLTGMLLLVLVHQWLDT